MYEAIIYFESGRYHKIESGTLESLREKCAPYVRRPSTLTIEVRKVEYIGHFKCPILEDNELL